MRRGERCSRVTSVWDAGGGNSRVGDPMPHSKIKRGLQADPAGQDVTEAAKTKTCPVGR